MSISISLKTRYDECDRIYEFLEKSLSHPMFAGIVSDESVDDLKTAAEEIFTNIVMHGYGGNPDGTVRMELQTDGSTVSLVISDSAPPYNPFAKLAVIKPGADLSQGGMGLTLIQSMTDEQHYSYENALNTVRLVKHAEKR